NVTYPGIVNEVGDNSISGAIAVNTGNGGNARIVVKPGTTLTLNGAIAPASTATTSRSVILDGGGDGTLNGIAADYTEGGKSIVFAVTKAGPGSWTLNAA